MLKQFWNETFLKEYRDNLVFEQFAMKGAADKNSGTLVHWLSLADLSAAAALSEGYDPTAYALSAGDQTATLTQYGATVLMSDLVKDTWIKGAMTNVIQRISRNAAKTIDTVIRDAVFTAGGMVQYAGTAVARNSIPFDSTFYVDVPEVREAVNSLEKANATRFTDGYFAGVIHPDVKYDLQGDTTYWLAAHQYTDKGVEKVYKGEAGEMYGVKFIMTTDALQMVNSGSANADVYQSYIVADGFLGTSDLQGLQIIVKDPLPSSTLNLTSTVGWKATFATRALKASGMVRLESSSTFGA